MSGDTQESGTHGSEDLWREYVLVLRDDKLDLEIPLSVPFDWLPGISPEDGKPLSHDQVQRLIEKASAEEEGGPPSLSDTFGVVREALAALISRQVGEGDPQEAERLGRLLQVASLFDCGVKYLVDHWLAVFSHARPDAVEARVAERVSQTLSPGQRVIIKKLDEIHDDVGLALLLWLTLAEASKRLNISPKTLHEKKMLHDLSQNVEKDLTKLNGWRISKKKQSSWRFEVDEVKRFALILDPGLVGNAGDSPETPRQSEEQPPSSEQSPAP